MPVVLPPPVLASARVLLYAVVDETMMHTGRRSVFVGGREVGPVPRLAIGRTLAGREILLLLCDPDWDVLAKTSHASIPDAQRAAEESYSGLRGKWQTISYTDAEVDAFLDVEDRGLVCSFCGRHPHEVAKIVTGHRGAAICEICIRAFRGQTGGS